MHELDTSYKKYSVTVNGLIYGWIQPIIPPSLQPILAEKKKKKQGIDLACPDLFRL